MVIQFHIELSLWAGLLAWLFSVYLAQPGEVFGWWPGLVQRLTKWEPANKLLYGCYRCMAGFWGLWAALATGAGFSAILCSALAMLTAMVLEKWAAWK